MPQRKQPTKKESSSPDHHEHVRVAIALGLLALATQINFYHVRFFGGDSVFLAFLFVVVALCFGLYLTLIAFRFAPGDGFLSKYMRSLGEYAHGAYVGTVAFSYALLAFTFSAFVESLFRPYLTEWNVAHLGQWIVLGLALLIIVLPAWNMRKR